MQTNYYYLPVPLLTKTNGWNGWCVAQGHACNNLAFHALYGVAVVIHVASVASYASAIILREMHVETTGHMYAVAVVQLHKSGMSCKSKSKRLEK
jgi:hypothetical protein